MVHRALSTALVVAVASLLATQTAWATGTRVRSMGAFHGVPTAGFNMTNYPSFVEGWLAYEDEVNIFFLPATLTHYGNRAMIDELQGNFAELDGFPRARFGFHYSITDFTVIALYGSNAETGVGMTRPSTGGESAFSAVTGNDQGDNTDPTNPDLMADLVASALFAHDFGGIRFGAGLHVWSDSFERKAPSSDIRDVSTWLVDIDLGLGLDFVGDNSLDFGLGIKFGSFTSVGTIQVPSGNQQVDQDFDYFKPETNFGIDLNARGMFWLTDGLQIVPFLHFAFERQGMTRFELAQANDGSGQLISQTLNYADSDHFGIEFGADLKIQPFENTPVFIYPTLGFRVDTWAVSGPSGDIDDDYSLVMPYYGFGLDARIWDWFAFRMGARQMVFINKNASRVSNAANPQDVAETDDRDTQIITTFDLGFALFFGENDNWIIEGHLQPEFFLNGPNFVSGNTTGPGLNLDAAVKYVW
jgi:hypothetical protein